MCKGVKDANKTYAELAKCKSNPSSCNKQLIIQNAQTIANVITGNSKDAANYASDYAKNGSPAGSPGSDSNAVPAVSSSTAQSDLKEIYNKNK
jgi:hypothetical protein